MSEVFLAGDVGGTKTNLAIFPADKEPTVPILQQTFSNANYPSLESLVRDFLSRTKVAVQHATLGVAGPVIGDRINATNIAWVVDRKQLLEEFGFSSAHLINDLVATAYSIPFLGQEDLRTINPGESVEHGTIALIAPGTGLGEAFQTWDGVRYGTHASEGGHADFAPTNPMEIQLLEFLRHRFDHVSYERVCSGHGIRNIYDYFHKDLAGNEKSWLEHETHRVLSADDLVPVIVEAALKGEPFCSPCVSTVDVFIDILAEEAGNLALKILPTGGVFIAGGVPIHMLPAIKNDQFIKVFTNKGRMSNLLSKIPVHIIVNPNAPLLGASHFCYDSLLTLGSN